MYIHVCMCAGTGLGLPVAKGIAHSLGGDLIVTFSPSTNVTVFAFSIPLVSAQAQDLLRQRRP
jgi:signal transduction histidine kinase